MSEKRVPCPACGEPKAKTAVCCSRCHWAARRAATAKAKGQACADHQYHPVGLPAYRRECPGNPEIPNGPHYWNLDEHNWGECAYCGGVSYFPSNNSLQWLKSQEEVLP